MSQEIRLICSSHQKASLVKNTRSCWVIVDLLGDVLIDTIDEYVAELVSADHGFVIDVCNAREPSWLRIVGEDQQLTRRYRPIHTVECGFLHISDDDTSTGHIDGHNRCRESL